MTERRIVEGPAVALAIENLDTDQIMPKQFLRGINKAGLAAGLLYDLRFDAAGAGRADCVLNRPEGAGARILVGGANFGCGSSREHAVWGLQQAGFEAVIAPSFGEIFYSNAMQNGLLAVMLPEAPARELMRRVLATPGSGVRIDLAAQRVACGPVEAGFDMAPRHRRMLMERLDVIGLTLTQREQIEAFARRQAAAQPWLVDVAARARARLDG